MEDRYLMRAENILGDEHSFVRLVDTMPQPIFCDFYPDEPEDRNEVQSWDEIQHCEKPASLSFHSALGEGGVYCEEHLPKKAPPLGEKGSYAHGLTERHYAPGDMRIVHAARVSIAGDNVDAKNPPERLIRYLVKNRHTTPLEQVKLTFHVRLPIFCARQWIRHRTGSFNEESARYGKLRGDFYYPPLERMNAQAKKNKQGSSAAVMAGAEQARAAIIEHSSRAYGFYEGLLEGGLARELARMVLPLNIYTQWFWSTDLHNLMHFLTLRTHGHAQGEMRNYADAIIPMARSVAPIAMDAWLEHREAWAKAMKL